MGEKDFMAQLQEILLSPSDLVEASKLYLRNSRSMLVLLLLVAVATGTYLVITTPSLSVESALMVGTIIGIVGVVAFLWYGAVYFVLMPLRARLSYRRHKAIQRAYSLSWNELGVTTTNANATGLTPWADYRKWLEGRKLFLLYVSDRLFHLVPKRAFVNEDAIASFREQLRARIALRPGRIQK